MTKFVYRNKQTIQQKSGNEQGGVTVAEETEIVAQGVAVYGFPVAVYKGRHQQQQSTLRLVEIGNHYLYDVVPVTRRNYDLSACLEHIQMMTVQVIQYLLESLDRCHCRIGLVRSPLLDMHIILSSIGMGTQIDANIVEALQSADRCGTHSNGLAAVSNQLLNGGALYGNELGMHFMPAYLLRFDRTESTRTHMQSQFLTVNAMCIKVLKHTLRKMKSCSRSRHATLYLGINRLISSLVALLRLPI